MADVTKTGTIHQPGDGCFDLLLGAIGNAFVLGVEKFEKRLEILDRRLCPLGVPHLWRRVASRTSTASCERIRPSRSAASPASTRAI
ncbi:hypothetical protein BH10PSE4_BH10PSE4_43490 [soil metagenome]